MPDFIRVRNSSLSIREREAPPLGLPPIVTGGSGRFKILVLDGGIIVEDRPWQKNLILDQGLNRVCSDTPWAGIFTHCAVGTGTTPTVDDSGIITATTSGLTCSSSAPFFSAGDVNKLLRFDSGEEAYIVEYLTDQSVTLSAELEVAEATLFALWRVSQTALTAESKRTATYLTGAGNCDTTQLSNVITWRRTFDFTAEVSNVNYSEVGWSWSATAASATLFSRALIAGGSVTVLAGQQLRIVYDLSCTISPATAQEHTPTITGWPVAPSTVTTGKLAVGSLNIATPSGISTVSTAGNASGVRTLDPTSQSSMALGTVGTIPTFGQDIAGNSVGFANTTSSTAYVTGSFERTRRGFWNVNTGNSASIRNVSMFEASYVIGARAFIFDEAQTKDNLHTLTIDFPVRVGRILTNP